LVIGALARWRAGEGPTKFETPEKTPGFDDEEYVPEDGAGAGGGGGGPRVTRSRSPSAICGAPEPDAEVDSAVVTFLKEQLGAQGIALLGRTESDEVRAEEAPRMKEEIAKFQEENKEQKQEIEDLHRVNKQQQAQVEKATEELRALKEQAKSIFS
jgi:hypothetical protein